MERLCVKNVNKLKKELKAGDKGKGAKDGSDDEMDDEEADGITFEDKVSFAEHVRMLHNDGLTKIVRFIKEN